MLTAAPRLLARARHLPDSLWAHPPKLVVERTFDLGRIDLGESADGRFEVTNAGDAPLIIHEAKASCRCQGVYREGASGVKETVRELLIAPGQSLTLGVRFVATGELNLLGYMVIDLFTNDPAEPIARLTVRYTPTAKLYCVPRTVIFGTVAPGSTVTTTVDVFAYGRADKIRPDPLTCHPADLFAVRYIPSRQDGEDVTLGNSIAAQIGRLEITFRAPQEARTINQPLVLVQEGKEFCRLPVSAHCVPDFQLFPAILVLPRRSAQGDVYSLTGSCRTRTGEAFTLRMKKKSAHLAVTIPQTEPGPVQSFTVTYEGDRPLTAEVMESLELTASTPTRSTDLHLDVKITPKETGQGSSEADQEKR